MVIYQAKNGAIELRGDYNNETIWGSLNQIAELFGRDKSVISRHLKNIYKEKELDIISTVAKIATVQKERQNNWTNSLTFKYKVNLYQISSLNNQTTKQIGG